MRLMVLGPRVELADDDTTPIPVTRGQVRQLLTLLAAADKHTAPAAVLAAQLIRKAPNAAAAGKSLIQAVYNTRAVLPEGRLLNDGAGYRLRVDADDTLDLTEHRDLVAEARWVRGTDPFTAVSLYRRAIALWGDRPLGDFPDTGPARTLQERILKELRAAREELAEVQLAIGAHTDLLGPAPGWLADDPLSEHLRGLVMIALYRSERKGEALRLYQEACELLGALPGAWLQRIHDQVRDNDPGLQWRPVGSAVLPHTAPPADIDTTKASPARVYDYLLGGSDNFPVDQEAAEVVIQAAPHLRAVARGNRYFLCQAVRDLAKAGIRQFLDIGSGLPTADNVHQVARRITPDARVVYVDNDPTVLAHGRALLVRDTDTTALIDGDLRDPAGILAAGETRRLLDPAEPTAVIMCAVAHFLTLEEGRDVIAALLKAFPSGSYLVLSHVTTDGSDEAAIRMLVGTAARQSTVRMYPKTGEEIRSLFCGLDMLEPGLMSPGAWRNDRPTVEGGLRTLGGVALKP